MKSLIKGHSYIFFQAEDGIRDLTVTGVQTCALPIYRRGHVSPGHEMRIRGLSPGAAWRRRDRGAVRAGGGHHRWPGPGHRHRALRFPQGPRVRRALLATALLGSLLSLGISSAGATSPSPCASPSAASASRTSCPAAVDPNQAAYDLLKTRLGGDVARALDAERKLIQTLDSFASTEQLLTAEVTQEEALISSLEDQIAKLDLQIADTQARIDVEKEQLVSLTRAIYRQPDSFWLLIARTGNLHEALMATADAVVAGQRAHTLQAKLEADLAPPPAAR